MLGKKAVLFALIAVVGGVTYYFLSVPSSVQKQQIAKESIDMVVVYKSRHVLEAYSHGELVKSYPISIGKNPIGHKEFEGDKKTPEGNYTIASKNPNSGWHKNLGVSYPNEEDIEHAKSIGKSAGGNIKVHGLRNGLGFIGTLHRTFDWTDGCIALSNDEMDELYDSVKVGSVIQINP